MNDQLLSLKVPGQNTDGGINAITPPPGFITTSGGDGLSGIIQWVIIVIVAIGVIAAFIFLLWGAIKWITSGGDKEKLESSRKTIIFAILGLIVVLFSLVIMQFTGGLLGISVLDRELAPYKKKDVDLSKCPDGSGNYWCGGSKQCAECSSDKSCKTAVYTIASCSGTPDNFSWCTIDGSTEECSHLQPSCEGGIVACVKPYGVQRGHCQTFSCPTNNSPDRGRP